MKHNDKPQKKIIFRSIDRNDRSKLSSFNKIEFCFLMKCNKKHCGNFNSFDKVKQVKKALKAYLHFVFHNKLFIFKEKTSALLWDINKAKCILYCVYHV